MQWDAMGVQVQGQCISNVSSWYSAVNLVVGTQALKQRV